MRFTASSAMIAVAFLPRRDVRQLEELPSRMGPTECGGDRSLRGAQDRTVRCSRCTRPPAGRPGSVGLAGGGLRELRVLREAVPPVEAAVRQGRQTGASKPTWVRGPTQRLPQRLVFEAKRPALPVQVTCNPQLSRARWNRLDSKTSPRRIAREAYFMHPITLALAIGSVSLNAMAQIALRKHLPSAVNDAFAR
jgi:hypothetical protein